MLFGCYRRGDANDPETYVAAITRVLASFDASLIREVTDPLTGIQTTEKYMTFMPQSGELKVYCDGVAARRDRLQKLGEMGRPDLSRLALPRPEPAPGDKATVFVPASNPRYPQLVEWAKKADPRLWRYEQRPGIWVALHIWDDRQTALRTVGNAARAIVEAAE
jgi:hypothetical protein